MPNGMVSAPKPVQATSLSWKELQKWTVSQSLRRSPNIFLVNVRPPAPRQSVHTTEISVSVVYFSQPRVENILMRPPWFDI